jgi:hypothetical protein
MAIEKCLNASINYVTSTDLHLIHEGYGPVLLSNAFHSFLSVAALGKGVWRDIYSSLGFSERFLDLLAFAQNSNVQIIHIDYCGDSNIRGFPLSVEREVATVN